MSNSADIDKLVERIAKKVTEGLAISTVPRFRRSAGPGRTRPGSRLGRGWCGSGETDGSSPRPSEVAKFIDPLLKPTATRDRSSRCEEARCRFASVCVNGVDSTRCGYTEGLPNDAICVVGFPLGAMAAVQGGNPRGDRGWGEEIDMVINIGALKGGDHDLVKDIKAVVRAAQGRPVKVILETTMLERDEKIVGCTLSKAAGAAFVKTSTGFGGGGATADDVALMRAVVGPDVV